MSLMGNKIRVTDANLKNGYWAEPKDGFQILDPSISNGVVLYCEVKNNKVINAVEIYECICTGDEKLLAKFGNYKKVLNHFQIKPINI